MLISAFDTYHSSYEREAWTSMKIIAKYNTPYFVNNIFIIDGGKSPQADVRIIECINDYE